VLPRNAGAIWRGRRCQTGQVITIDPGQEGDHMSAADYLMVGLTVDRVARLPRRREMAAVIRPWGPGEVLLEWGVTACCLRRADSHRSDCPPDLTCTTVTLGA
jgi:hypothetical protein